MQGDPGAAGLAKAAGETVVVGMDVGDKCRADVTDTVPGHGEPVDQRLPRRLGVPARVDHGDTVVQLEQVHDDVAQRVVRDGHRHRPQLRADLLDCGKHAVTPGLALRRPGHLDGTHDSGS